VPGTAILLLTQGVICENYDFPSVGHFIVFVVNITFRLHEILSLCTLSKGTKVLTKGLRINNNIVQTQNLQV